MTLRLAALKRRLAMLTLVLYPLAFRRRYGDEMRALIEEMPMGPLVLLDLVRGALDAHVRPADGLTAVIDTGDRLRASATGVLACWVIFAAAGFGFYKTTEDAPFAAAGDAHALLGAAHLAVQLLAIVASAAVVLGAAPLIVAALRSSRRQRSLRIVVSLPVISASLFAGLTVLLKLLARSQHSHRVTTTGGEAFIAWTFAGLACAAVCVLAARRALFAVPVARRWLVSALWCATVVTAAMTAMAFATTVYTIVLQLDASRLAAAPNGPLAATSAAVSLLLQLTAMVLTGALATISTYRGWLTLSSTRALRA